MILKNIHEKLLAGIQTMLIDTKINLPYYGEFNLHINFVENDSVGTCGVNVSSKGMNFFYSPKFLEDMSQKEVNFITLHEDFHLLFNHPKRTVTGQYDHKMSNIAQDMIINHVIWEDIPHAFVEIPKNKDGKNMALFVPKEYTGKLIFEELYEWLKDEKEKWQKEQKKNSECKSCGGSGKKDQGQGQQDQKQKGQGQQPGDGEGQGEARASHRARIRECDASSTTDDRGIRTQAHQACVRAPSLLHRMQSGILDQHQGCTTFVSKVPTSPHHSSQRQKQHKHNQIC